MSIVGTFAAVAAKKDLSCFKEEFEELLFTPMSRNELDTYLYFFEARLDVLHELYQRCGRHLPQRLQEQFERDYAKLRSDILRLY
ncbi:MAG: hypothetical protein HYX24_06610 [Candidatus Aenigmarchaeota archaeon]|nr:hypothetical protein [Candidatus Aenigmarchaeota archaeon]